MLKACSKVILAGLGCGSMPGLAAVVYQLPVRTYLASGTTLATTGRLDRLTPEILSSIRELGVDHLWLTGVVEHATPDNTDPDAVKGEAGSYYAIHDAWDVDPAIGSRADFRAVVDRAHKTGMKVLIDLVPNHTARTHRTDVAGKSDFGDGDNSSKFFDPANNYFYLPGETFVPPSAQGPAKSGTGTDGQFDTDPGRAGIQFENPARVTGNNVKSGRASKHDWYETAKLNYGFDFTTGRGHYNPRPRTWDMMVRVANHWIEMGVDGFRIDFAHAVPLEFWNYFSATLRKTKKDLFLLAEVYENDHGMRVPGFSYQALLNAGIDSVYQSELYWALHAQAQAQSKPQGHGQAHALSPRHLPLMRPEIVASGAALTSYVENHDEVRVASRHFAPSISSSDDRSRYGLALAAYAALLPGNFLMNGGQELAEDASITGPFAGDSGKTSIFDFVFQAETKKWLDGEGTGLQKDLRRLYTSLFSLRRLPAFAARHTREESSLIDLSGPNQSKPEAQWLASYVRFDPRSGQAFLVITNTDPRNAHAATIHFTEQDGQDSTGALKAMGVSRDPQQRFKFTDIWTQAGWSPSDPALGNKPGVPGDVLYRPGNVPSGLYLGRVSAGTTLVLQVTKVAR